MHQEVRAMAKEVPQALIMVGSAFWEIKPRIATGHLAQGVLLDLERKTTAGLLVNEALLPAKTLIGLLAGDLAAELGMVLGQAARDRARK
jgi:hypothetical protein